MAAASSSILMASRNLDEGVPHSTREFNECNGSDDGRGCFRGQSDACSPKRIGDEREERNKERETKREKQGERNKERERPRNSGRVPLW